MTARACQGGDHGEAGASVGTDNRVHALAEHIKGDAQCNPEEVLLRQPEGFFIDRTAEQRQQRFAEHQIAGRQQQAGGHAAQHGAADAAAGILRLFPAQTEADEGTAAVADHDGYSQRDDRQGKNHRIGRVAVGTEVAGIGDEDLIDDIIQRRHQQRDDTGNGVFSHQLGDRGSFQKGLFHIRFLFLYFAVGTKKAQVSKRGLRFWQNRRRKSVYLDLRLSATQRIYFSTDFGKKQKGIFISAGRSFGFQRKEGF